MKYLCVICEAPCQHACAMCEACGRAYDRWNLGEEETMGLIVWVAARTRRLLRQRLRRRTGT